MSAPVRLVPYGPDVEHSQFDPRPRRRGPKKPLTPAQQAYAAACEAQDAARTAMVAAEVGWQAALSAVVACRAAMEREHEHQVGWLEHAKECPLIGGKS